MLTLMYADVRTSVLLQTARDIVSNPDKPERQMDVRIIFDGGSERSFITHEVRQMLGLHIESTETIFIKTSDPVLTESKCVMLFNLL